MIKYNTPYCNHLLFGDWFSPEYGSSSDHYTRTCMYREKVEITSFYIKNVCWMYKDKLSWKSA